MLVYIYIVLHLYFSPLPPPLSLSLSLSILSLLQDGMICEQGTHAKLLEAGGMYAAMWNQQQQSLIKESVAGQEGGETEL